MSTVEILRAAKARIDTPDKWLGDLGGGEGRYHCGDRACILAAIRSVVGEWFLYSHPAQRALARVIGENPDDWYAVGCWNDTHTHAEVMAAFDIAIANEEAREQEHNPQLVSASPITLVPVTA